MFQYCPMCGEKYSDNFRVLDKQNCRKCNFVFYNNPKPVVNAFIVRPKDHALLLVQRAKEPYPGYWGIPGGFVSYSEEPQQALQRELKEELGVRVKVKNILGTFSELYYNEGKSDELYTTITLVYSTQLLSDKFILSEEIFDFGYFVTKDLPKAIAFSNQKKFLINTLKKIL